MTGSQTATDLRTTLVWRLLCLLAWLTALALITGLYWWLPPVWQGLAILPGFLVALLLVVASAQDSGRSLRGSSGR